MEDKDNKRKKGYANLDEIQNEIRELTDDEMDEFLEKKYGAIKEDINPTDSDSGNIIKFKPRNNKTFH